MSFFGAFLRGAGGAGLSELSRTLERRDELAFAREQAEKNREDQQRARREELEYRYGQGGGVLARSRGRRGGGDDEEDSGVTREQAGVDFLMAKHGMTEPEARAIVAGGRTGQNPLTRPTQRTEQIDDGDRQRTVTVNGTEPDVQRFRELMADVGQAMLTGVGGNPAQRAEARQKEQLGSAARRGAGGDQSAAREAMILSGDQEFNRGNSSITGKYVPGSEAEAAATKDRAAAGKDSRETSTMPTRQAKQAADVVKAEQLALDRAEDNARALIPPLKLNTLSQPELSALVASSPEVVAAKARLAAAQQRYDAAVAEGDKKPGKGGDKPKVNAERARADAKRVIERRPDQRDEVLRRLRAAGISTAGL